MRMYIRLILTFVAASSVLLLFGCSINSIDTKKESKKTFQSKWEQSPLFVSDSYTMIGEKNKVGFIYDDKEIVRFYPEKVQKYMWHFWGAKRGDTLKVNAIKENTGEKILILDNVKIGDKNNGADAHYPSNMSLPKSGMWKLDTYINNKLFGSIYIKVHER